MAQPHPPAEPSAHPTEGLPASMAATSTQVSVPQLAPPPPSRSRRALILTGCALLGIAIGVTGQRFTISAPASVAAPKPSTATAAVTLKATVTPVSTVGTSFKQKDGAWQSQRYSDANFGKLKEGIGLRLDLGTARSVTTVTFTAENGPLTVELRAGDEPTNNGQDYTLVGDPVQTSGATTLPAAAGGSHRYWMIWVTKLSSDGTARIKDSVVVKGQPTG